MAILAMICLSGGKWWKIEKSLDKNTWRFHAKLRCLPCVKFIIHSPLDLSAFCKSFHTIKLFWKDFWRKILVFSVFPEWNFLCLFPCSFFFFSRFSSLPFFLSEMSNYKTVAKQKPIGYLNWDAWISPKCTAKRLDYILHFTILSHFTTYIIFE